VKILILVLVLGTAAYFFMRPETLLRAAETNNVNLTTTKTMTYPITKTDAEWRKQLNPEQYHVLREAGTERAFTGAYWETKEPGVYRCAGCGEILFTSNTKFDSGCGWPSFYDLASLKSVIVRDDLSHGMHRKEVLCAKCGGHLGHVFDDGPGPTGLRYCINSASIILERTNAPDTKAPGK
jgi:peptide-methionine (R)-S-oxide reductase